MEFEIERSPASRDLTFKGRISEHELADLRLDRMDSALLADVDGDKKAMAADYLLVLEMLYRRHAEQSRAQENPNVLGEFSAKGKLPERTYLAANTPTLYDGYYPPYFNVTAISGTSGRLHQVELTVRQPTLQDLPPGETTVVVVAERNTALDWKEFVKCVKEADKKFDTIDYSDSCF